MVHPRNRPSLSAGVEAFFAEGPFMGAPPVVVPSTVTWDPGAPLRKRNDAGVLIVTWKGVIPGVERSAVHVKQIAADKERLSNYRWLVLSPKLRFDGLARSKEEAFGMAERAAGAFPYWLQRIRELREKYGDGTPVITETERRVFGAIELLVGAQPRYTPVRGARVWTLREEDISEERMDDWVRHGHTVCSMLRDLSR